MSASRSSRATARRWCFPIPAKAPTARSGCAKQVYEADPDAYFYPDQYNNPANWKAHFDGTAVEILEQTGGAITHFVACMGTSGTFMGTSRRLKRDMPGIQCISAQPSSGFHGLEGLKHMPTAIVPGIYDPSLADDNLWIETEDAYRMTRWLGRNEGLLVGCPREPMSMRRAKWRRRLVEEGRQRRGRHGAVRRRDQISERAFLE